MFETTWILIIYPLLSIENTSQSSLWLQSRNVKVSRGPQNVKLCHENNFRAGFSLYSEPNCKVRVVLWKWHSQVSEMKQKKWFQETEWWGGHRQMPSKRNLQTFTEMQDKHKHPEILKFLHSNTFTRILLYFICCKRTVPPLISALENWKSQLLQQQGTET